MKYRKGYKYQLAETISFQTCVFPEEDICTEYICLSTYGRLTIQHGYSWDGASGPTIDTKSSMQGALIHDALYQLLRMGLLPSVCRLQVDLEFKRRLIQDGMYRWRAEIWYSGVRKCAGFAADPRNKKKTYEAP